MKKLKLWHIIAIVGLFVLFGVRVFFSLEKKKDQERQQRIIRDLSIEQSNADTIEYHKEVIVPKEQKETLDSIQHQLDSLGEKMKTDHERFKQQFGIDEEE